MERFMLLFISVFSMLNSAELELINPDKSWFVIFLDIDGVLYREPTRDHFWGERKEKMVEMFGKLDRYQAFHYDAATAYYFNQEAVKLLENFIDQINLQYNVGIVISSTWREGHTLEELRQIFSPWRFSEFIIDKTIPTAYEGYTKEERQKFRYGFPLRADQINHWLIHSTLQIEHFVIFDDQDGDISNRFPNQFIYIKTPYLSLQHIQAAMEILEKAKN